MIKSIVAILLLMIVNICTYAQCTSCAIPQDQFSEFCYTSAEIPGYCAIFSDKYNKFRLAMGKKVRELPSSKVYDNQYFLGLAKNKALKLTALELLFVQEATNKWTVERRKFGHTYTPSGLGYKILAAGDGELPEVGKPVKVHYTGYLEDGTKFDSSVDRGTPFSFVLGQGQVIKGWDEGVAMLKIGTKAILLIPPGIAYGEARRGPIPANSTLFFEIELLQD